MKVVDQFQRCRIAELQRAQSRSNFAHKNVTFIKSLSLFCDGQHDLSDGDDGDDDVDDNDDNGDDDGDDHEVKSRSRVGGVAVFSKTFARRLSSKRTIGIVRVNR